MASIHLYKWCWCKRECFHVVLLSCLVARKIWLLWVLDNGKQISEFADQPDGISLTIYLTGVPSAHSMAKGPGIKKWNFMQKNFLKSCSGRIKRSTSGGSPQISNGISGKSPYHLTTKISQFFGYMVSTLCLLIVTRPRLSIMVTKQTFCIVLLALFFVQILSFSMELWALAITGNREIH